jgi:hypothetical protein
MEANAESIVVTRAEATGWWVRKVSWVNRKAAPDRVFAKNGRTVWIEFKDKGKEPGLLQTREHAEMRRAGMEVYTCDTVLEALKILGLK